MAQQSMKRIHNHTTTCIQDGCGKSFNWGDPELRDTAMLKPFWSKYCPEHRVKVQDKRILRVTVQRHPDYSEHGSERDTDKIGIVVEAEVKLTASRTDLFQRVTSGGLWGIDARCDDGGHLDEIAQEQLFELRGQLHAIGFSNREITAAFINVVRS